MDPVPSASTGALLDVIAQVLHQHRVPTRAVALAAAFASRQQLADGLAVDAAQLVRMCAFSVSVHRQILVTVTSGRRTLSLHRLAKHLGSAADPIQRLHPGHPSPLVAALERRNQAANSTALPLFLVDDSAAPLPELLFIAGDRAVLLGVQLQHLLDSGLAVLAGISNTEDEQRSQEELVMANLVDSATLSSTGQAIPSPCISVCRVDFETNQCEGCFRTLGEVSRWSRMEDPEKKRLLAQLVDRAKQSYFLG